MPKVLTNGAERAARLLDIMSLWWSGSHVVEIAEKHSISRQRAYKILRWVGCYWQLRRCKWVSRYDDPTWRPAVDEVARARGIVEHPAFRRLTTRQRSAVAWRALGCNMVATAHRMGTFPSVVRDVLIGTFRKMERLTWEAEHRSTRKVTPDPLPEYDLLEIEDLLPPK
jgi:hypothetical protein